MCSILLPSGYVRVMQLVCSNLLPSGYVGAAYVLKIRNNIILNKYKMVTKYKMAVMRQDVTRVTLLADGDRPGVCYVF